MYRGDEDPLQVQRPWFRQIPTLSRIAFVVSILAGFAELAVLLLGSGPLGGYVAIALAMGGVVVARTYPWPGLSLIWLGIVVDAVFWDPLVIWTIAAFTVFTMTLRGASVVGTGLTTGAVAFGASVYADEAGFFDAGAITGFSVCLAIAAIGNAVRNRDRYWNALDDRARDAAAARANETERRVAEERLRIARDLHDMVGHEVAVLSMNLGLAEVRLPPNSDGSRAAIEQARVGVQTLLEETQSILEVLRGSADTDDLTVGAVPGIARLDELFESYRSLGLAIDVTTAIESTHLAPTVDVAVYRVVQEALTNAHRHGDGTACVRLELVEGRILVHVSNPRRRSATGDRGRSGYGLVGMRERVTSAGGRLDIGGTDSMFTVEANMPVGQVV